MNPVVPVTASRQQDRPAGSEAAAPPPPTTRATRAAGDDCPPFQDADAAAADPRHSPSSHSRNRAPRSWPLLVLALPAAVAVWTGWVGIGQMTGFGQVHPLPGIWNSFHLNTAITLPIGVEAYAAYALRAWLTSNPAVTARTRRFARWSAILSLLLGMAGQVTYHLLTQAHTTHAPGGITTAVACLPVLVLGMGAALAHLLHAGTHHLEPATSREPQAQPRNTQTGTRPATGPPSPGRLALAQAATADLTATGLRVSRRTLRTAGIHGSNTELSHLAQTLKTAGR